MLSWGVKLETGIRLIDSQHKELVLRYNKIVEATSPKEPPRKEKEIRIEIGYLLDDLLEYTRYHFKTEEILQKMFEYPNKDYHHRLHKLFVKAIIELQNRYSNGQNVAKKLITYVREWLTFHIMREDMKLGVYLKNQDPKMVESRSIEILQLLKDEKKVEMESPVLYSQKKPNKTTRILTSLRLNGLFEEEETNGKKNFFFIILENICSFTFCSLFFLNIIFVFFSMITYIMMIYLPVYNWIKHIIGITLIIIGIICISLCSLFFSHGWEFGIRILSKEMNRVVNLNVMQESYLHKMNGYNMKEFKKIENNFKNFLKGIENYLKFLPLSIVQSIVRSNEMVKLDLNSNFCTIVFNDIANFTTMTEQMETDQLIYMLEQFFNICNTAVVSQGGFVLNFLGDGLMFIFGCPKFLPNHPSKALKAVFEMLKNLEKLNKKGELPELYVRFGVNTDKMLVGNVGDKNRMYYSALGDPVNISARCEALGKVYKSHLIFTENTHNLVKDDFQTRWVDTVLLKGKTQSLDIYTASPISKENKFYSKSKSKEFNKSKRIGDLSMQLRDLYNENKYEEAKKVSKEILKLNENDVPANFLLSRLSNVSMKEGKNKFFVQTKEGELQSKKSDVVSRKLSFCVTKIE